MPSLTYPATISGIPHQVKIADVHGAAGLYHVYLDDFFIGSIERKGSGLVPHIDGRTGLAGDDVAAIIEVIEKEFGE